jgi:hypothetical protein
LPDFGQEFSRPFLDDGNHMAQAVVGADRNRALQKQKHTGTRLAGLDQEIAYFILADIAEPAQPLNLLRPELWKHLIAALVYRGHGRTTRGSQFRI